MTNLSPAAQAVLDAANYIYDRAGTTGHGLAAALRAVAEQLVPQVYLPERFYSGEDFEEYARQMTRQQLLAIADELEACCAEVAWLESSETAKRMRERRRPKPPTLKEQALTALHAIATGANDIREQHQDFDTICKALEQLDDE